jgi:DNA repair photolyase
MQINKVEAKSILNPTGGFLSSFTHTINPYGGCQLGQSLCGNYCYARAIIRGVKQESQEWGKYLDAKTNAAELYKIDIANARRAGKPVRIFMSSVTDPYVPVEKELRITRKILEAMTEMPPDALVVQTHTPNVLWDLKILMNLRKTCHLSVQISVETDMENDDLDRLDTRVNFRHAYSVSSRLEALLKLKENGIFSVATMSPLLPLKDPLNLAKKLDSCCDYVILDHFLIGDGSNGRRTKSKTYFEEPLPIILENNHLGDWNHLKKFYEVAKIFEVVGKNRLGISKDGFADAQNKA